MPCINVKNYKYGKHATEIVFFRSWKTEISRTNKSQKIEIVTQFSCIETAINWVEIFLVSCFDVLRVCHLDYSDKCDLHSNVRMCNGKNRIWQVPLCSLRD